MFATEPQLAGTLLDCAHSRGIRAAFVAGDENGGGRDLNHAIRGRGMGYVLAVRANHTITTRSARTLSAAQGMKLIPGHAWHRVRTGSGTKGIRHYDWATLEMTGEDTPGKQPGHDDGHSVLPVRRHRSTGTLSFYRCWTPGPVPLSRLYLAVAAALQRQHHDGNDLIWG